MSVSICEEDAMIIKDGTGEMSVVFLAELSELSGFERTAVEGRRKR